MSELRDLYQEVIIDAEAVEIAQPLPWKPMSWMTSSRSSRYTVTLSPHSGFTPSALRLALSGRRKFRGRLPWSRISSW